MGTVDGATKEGAISIVICRRPGGRVQARVVSAGQQPRQSAFACVVLAAARLRRSEPVKRGFVSGVEIPPNGPRSRRIV